MANIDVLDIAFPLYNIEFPEFSIKHVSYTWASQIDEKLASKIISLMREVTSSTPIIGFGKTIVDEEAWKYVDELRENLKAGKCRLLTIIGNNGELMGLCTLKHNLNPNNSHIADLAKGMIAEKFRGQDVLSAAFYEIALMCEDNGVDLVTLDVRAETRAHHVWKHYGFVTYGVLPAYAKINGALFAGHFMMQEVDDLKARMEPILLRRVSGGRANLDELGISTDDDEYCRVTRTH